MHHNISKIMQKSVSKIQVVGFEGEKKIGILI